MPTVFNVEGMWHSVPVDLSATKSTSMSENLPTECVRMRHRLHSEQQTGMCEAREMYVFYREIPIRSIGIIFVSFSGECCAARNESLILNSDCPTPCDRTCANRGDICAIDSCGQTGCYCNEGYIRDENDRCILEEECSKTV